MPSASLLRTVLALALLGGATIGQGDEDPDHELGFGADMSNAPRVTIDRPKPVFMLVERRSGTADGGSVSQPTPRQTQGAKLRSTP